MRKRWLFFIFFNFLFILFFGSQLSAMSFNNDKVDGKIVLVEYYDYECPHCRDMQAVLEKLQLQYPQLSIIYRATPLLTDQSQAIASLVLASEKQRHTLSLHQALMRLPHTPSANETLLISEKLGLNAQALLQRAQQIDIENQLKNNIRLAETHATGESLHLPLLIIGKVDGSSPSFTLTGEQPYELLSAMIQQLGQDDVQMAKQENSKGR